MDKITTVLNADKYIKMALEEDISGEDVSTNSVIPDGKKGEVDLICKENGILAGVDVFFRVFKLLDKNVEGDFYYKDGDRVGNGDKIGKLTGDIRVLLSGERTALNFLQRMSGISTYTRKMVKLLEGSNTVLLDTRKTTPNMRIFEKYAVKIGGASNHRYNLTDGVLLKDNHIGAAGGVKQAIEKAKAYAPFVRKIEIEVESLEMMEEALNAGADIIMLDNMDIDTIREAVKMAKGRALTECSGNVTEKNIKTIISTGVDYISSGALTHSAPILDMSLKNLHPLNS